MPEGPEKARISERHRITHAEPERDRRVVATDDDLSRSRDRRDARSRSDRVRRAVRIVGYVPRDVPLLVGVVARLRYRAAHQAHRRDAARPAPRRVAIGGSGAGGGDEQQHRRVGGDGHREDRRHRHIEQHDDVHRARVEQRAGERARVHGVLHSLAEGDRLTDAGEVVEHPDDDRRHEDAEQHHGAAVIPQQGASKVIHTRTPLPGWAGPPRREGSRNGHRPTPTASRAMAPRRIPSRACHRRPRSPH